MTLLSDIQHLSSKIVQDNNPESQVLRKVSNTFVQHSSGISQLKFKLNEKLSHSPPYHIK